MKTPLRQGALRKSVPLLFFIVSAACGKVAENTIDQASPSGGATFFLPI